MVTKKETKWERLIHKLTSKYRLVIMDEETFEEQTSFLLSRINVYIFVSTVLVLVVAGVVSTIIFTPIKAYIPGYSDEVKTKKALTILKYRIDSLEELNDTRELYLQNIRNMVEGKVDTETSDAVNQRIKVDTSQLSRTSIEDSLLRMEMEQEEKFSIVPSNKKRATQLSITDFYFFPPIRGLVTNEFNPNESHNGIDIVAPENETIKATLDGYVIFADWTVETGYVIAIQHENNLVSFYKHNSVLLKKTSNFVKAGDAIAIIGNSGELTSGPHLHFELWYNGIALNPKEYIIF